MSEATQDPPVERAENPTPTETPPPAWDFSPADPPEKEYVTVDQFNELKELITQAARPQQPVYDDPADQELARINEMQFTDPVKAERMRVDYMQRSIGQGLEERVDAVLAPTVRTGLASKLASDLGEVGMSYINEKLSGYSAQQLAQISQDKPTLDLLRDAAENAARRKTGPAVAAPKSESAAAVPTVRIDAESERELDAMYRAFKEQGVPGLPTRDVFMAQIMEAN